MHIMRLLPFIELLIKREYCNRGVSLIGQQSMCKLLSRRAINHLILIYKIRFKFWKFKIASKKAKLFIIPACAFLILRKFDSIFIQLFASDFLESIQSIRWSWTRKHRNIILWCYICLPNWFSIPIDPICIWAPNKSIVKIPQHLLE